MSHLTPEELNAALHLEWDVEALHLEARGFPAQGYTLMPERIEDGRQYPPVGYYHPKSPYETKPKPLKKSRPLKIRRAKRVDAPRAIRHQGIKVAAPKRVLKKKQPRTAKAPPAKPTLSLGLPADCTFIDALPDYCPAAAWQAEVRLKAGCKQGQCQVCLRWRWADEPCRIAQFKPGKSPVSKKFKLQDFL